MSTPDWPSCRDCRFWSDHCTYCRRLHLRWQYEPTPRSVRACCRFWRGPEGETRRQRCRDVNADLDGFRPSSGPPTYQPARP